MKCCDALISCEHDWFYFCCVFKIEKSTTAKEALTLIEKYSFNVAANTCFASDVVNAKKYNVRKLFMLMCCQGMS